MRLLTLLAAIGKEIGVKHDREITDICHDSRKAGGSSLFVCIRGAVSDGHNYARSAYNKGCRAFVAECDIELPDDALVVKCEDTRKALALLSSAIYSHPSKSLKIIGITGTKGKTTTALLIYHILNASGIRTAYIGSNGIDYDDLHFETVNTTPESCELHKYMRGMVDAGIKWLVMEVSSQSLYLERVHGINFEIAIFTNLSPDHIGPSEHPTFEHYKASKRSLFSRHSPKYIICNKDDENTPYMIGGTNARVIYFSLRQPAEYTASDISLYRDARSMGVGFTLHHKSAKETVSLTFPGEFSVYNGMAAIIASHIAGISLQGATALIKGARIRGRFETYCSCDGVTYVIDYAHNKISLSSALSTLRLYEPHRLICVFGSVGGRTFERRHELGEAAAELADIAIITSDNPDSEPPMNIIREIAKEFSHSNTPHYEIPDRKEAIIKAKELAEPGDIVLLAGKGHENYQLVCGKKEPFSEKEILLSEISQSVQKAL